ncbi:hypothetical protein EV177_010389, partial [Coemansia sp. RSA 1804]
MRSGKKTDILELLQQSLVRCDTTKAWCSKCKKFQFLSTLKRMTQPPDGYIVVNFPKLDPPLLPPKSVTGSGIVQTPLSALAGGDHGPSVSSSGEQQMAASWQTSLPLGFTLDLDRQSEDQQVHVGALGCSAGLEDGEERSADATYQLAA